MFLQHSCITLSLSPPAGGGVQLPHLFAASQEGGARGSSADGERGSAGRRPRRSGLPTRSGTIQQSMLSAGGPQPQV